MALGPDEGKFNFVADRPGTYRMACQPKTKAGRPARVALLQLSVLRLGFLQDGDVGVGVFPEREEILISAASFGGVAGLGIRPRQA